MLTHERAVGDILTRFAVTLQDNGVARDLTGKTVVFKMNTIAGGVIIAAGACNITLPATNGQVEYDFQPADVANPGVFKAWFVILDGSNEPETFPNDEDGIAVTIFSRTANTTPPDPTIDIVALANAPIRTRTVEGTVEERSVNELIKADQYAASKAASTSGQPWGIKVARTRPGGMVT